MLNEVKNADKLLLTRFLFFKGRERAHPGTRVFSILTFDEEFKPNEV